MGGRDKAVTAFQHASHSSSNITDGSERCILVAVSTNLSFLKNTKI